MGTEILIPKLIRASLENDFRTVRSLAMRAIRQLKSTDPAIAEEIARALDFHGVGISPKRSVGIDSSPVDSESRLALTAVEEPVECNPPILSSHVIQIIDDFIQEREQSSKLLAVGINPPSSILLYGPPGVGKTHLARYLSGALNLKLVTLDLAASISSYLGRTGQNVKSIFDYARSEPSLLFLDEFDAIAKKRDDLSDLGELKRIVNVLLKELEDWPPHSIIIAATNHSNLLDKAIWRRFDRVLELTLPGRNERICILKEQFLNYPFADNLISLFPIMSDLTEGMSGADLCKLSERIKRKTVLGEIGVVEVALKELALLSRDEVEFRKKFSKVAKKTTNLSIREIADLLGKSPSAIQYYLKGEKSDGEEILADPR